MGHTFGRLAGIHAGFGWDRVLIAPTGPADTRPQVWKLRLALFEGISRLSGPATKVSVLLVKNLTTFASNQPS